MPCPSCRPFRPTEAVYGDLFSPDPVEIAPGAESGSHPGRFGLAAKRPAPSWCASTWPERCGSRFRLRRCGIIEGYPPAPGALSELLPALRIAAGPHGFRSSFRDWASYLVGARTAQQAGSGPEPLRIRRRWVSLLKFAAAPQEKTRGNAPWTPVRDKGLKIQGVTVRATRNPSRMNRTVAGPLKRYAERRSLGLLSKDPPRNTRREQSPLSQAEPSDGAP